MTRLATESEAQAFTDLMAEHFGARIVDRDDAWEFQVFQGALKAAGIPDLTQLLDGRSFTAGSWIYLTPGLPPNRKIRTVCHELVHARQWSKDKLKFAYFYATSGHKRVGYEVPGFYAAAEIEYAMTGRLPSLDDLAGQLNHGYALGAADLLLARDMLESAATSISSGIVSSEEARYGIELLHQHFPELLAT